MKKSGLFFHSITFIALVVAFIFLWDYSQETTSVESDLTSSENASASIFRLQENIYRMLPILIGSILISVAFAIYLVEWSSESGWIYRIVDIIIRVFAGIPSIFYGLLCIYFFVFKTNGVSYPTRSLSVVLLTIPITVQTTQYAVKGVDRSIREAAYALGVKKLRVITDHVIPHAYPNILSGICNAISRAFAVAALMLVVFVWSRNTFQSGASFELPNNVILLLSTAILYSIFSSILKKQLSTVN